MRQGRLEEALKEYREGLSIRQRLAASDPTNTQWQRDAFQAQEKLDDALKAYYDSLSIRERLVAADHSNTEWQRDLELTYNRIGDVLRAQSNLDEALKCYHNSLAIVERLAATDPSNTQWQRDLQVSISKVGGLAYNLVLARNFAVALEAVDQAILLAPEQIWLYTNRAHALMFLDRTDEARALYLKYRGAQKVSGDKSWETVILEDFAEFQKAGLTHPLMQEIEKAFAGS